MGHQLRRSPGKVLVVWDGLPHLPQQRREWAFRRARLTGATRTAARLCSQLNSDEEKAPSPQGRRRRAGNIRKKLPLRAAKRKEAYPTAKVEVWCEDEHRLGLKPIIGKAWSPIGGRPLEGPSAIQVDLPLGRLRAPENRGVAPAHPTHRERTGVLDSFGELSQESGSGQQQTHPARTRSSRVTQGQEAKGCPKGYTWSSYPRVPRSYVSPNGSRCFPNEGVRNRHFEKTEELEEALAKRCVALCNRPEVV